MLLRFGIVYYDADLYNSRDCEIFNLVNQIMAMILGRGEAKLKLNLVVIYNRRKNRSAIIFFEFKMDRAKRHDF